MNHWLTQSTATLLVASIGAVQAMDTPQQRELSLEPRLHLAASYLHAQIGDQGMMVYRRDALTGKPQPGRYNLLRHAGSVLALAEYHQQHPPDAGQRARMQSALAFLSRCCLRPSVPGADDLALWSDPPLVGERRSYPVAKLGGAGLALAAMAQWRRVQPDHVPLQSMQALGRFILSMQTEDGEFRSLHALQGGEHDPQWVSLYYPGEAVLGLVLLFEHDGDRRWLEAAVDGLRALARQREAPSAAPPDHWALLATARLWQQDRLALEAALPHGFSWSPTEGQTAVGPVLLRHAWSVAQSMLREQASSNASACARGSYSADGRTTPTATRLEGLLGLAPIVPGHKKQQALTRSIAAGMAFLLQAQRLDGPVLGSFSRVTPACPSDDRRAHEVRIDYVQHALAAMQAYRSLGLSSNSP